jgi:serine/threonine protein kinase
VTDVFERRCRLCGAAVPAKSTFCSRCGAAAARNADGGEDEELADQVRTLFAGEFAIDREIGRGAMAVVYLGFDLELERRVAIKVLPPDIADAEMADRFKREAKMVASLSHRNVIPIYGVRNSPTISAIIMQLVDGNSLDVVLRERGSSTLPLPVAGLILSQIAAGLEHAHARGVIHRDVKPANVLLDPAGQIFVSDFGIARRYGGVSATGSGVLLGTASYMSPEQCLGRRAEASSDQYAFGVMAFEILAGRRPFAGRSSELLNAHINHPPPRLTEVRPDLTPEIESFVMRALEKDPAARHPSLREAERFFRRLVPDERSASTQLLHVSLRKPMEASRPAAAVVESATPVVKTEDRPGRGGPRSFGLLTAGAVLAAVLVAGVVMLRPARRGGEKKPVPSISEIPQPAGAAAKRSPTMPAHSANKKANRMPDRPAAGSMTAAQPQRQTIQLPTATTEPAIKPPADSAVRSDTAGVGARLQGEVQRATVVTPPPPAPSVTATAADARAVASEFLTWCNHRQWRDVERLPSLEGSADLRNELIRLIRSAPDFQAGFERLASRPVLADRTFMTDFVLDLEWRGGQRQLAVTVSAELSNGSWHLAGFGAHAPD